MTTASHDVAERHRPAAALPEEYLRLERLVRKLADELAGYRARTELAERRSIELERALRDVDTGALDPLSLRERIQALEKENKALRSRMVRAQDRIRRLVARFDFLREDL
jgi:FtsZ-binding cell division protein ZapB